MVQMEKTGRAALCKGLNMGDAVNLGAFRAAILIALPVAGFVPFLTFYPVTENVPNPIIAVFSPLLSPSSIEVMIDLSARIATAFSKFVALTILLMRSVLTSPPSSLFSGLVHRLILILRVLAEGDCDRTALVLAARVCRYCIVHGPAARSADRVHRNP
jgi:hypothetical protein